MVHPITPDQAEPLLREVLQEAVRGGVASQRLFAYAWYRGGQKIEFPVSSTMRTMAHHMAHATYGVWPLCNQYKGCPHSSGEWEEVEIEFYAAMCGAGLPVIGGLKQ